MVFDVIHQLWINFQHGQLPDLGSWNYMLMAMFLMLQGRPSALVGGIAAAAGYLNLGLIILVAVVARVFVDLFWYRVGATGYIDRLGSRIGGYEEMAGRVQDGINQRPIRFVLLAKLSNGLALPMVIAAGSAHVPLRRWLPASFFGELLWTIPLLLLGYFATDALSGIEGGLSYLTTGLTVLFALGLVAYFVRARRRRSTQES